MDKSAQWQEAVITLQLAEILERKKLYVPFAAVHGSPACLASSCRFRAVKSIPGWNVSLNDANKRFGHTNRISKDRAFPYCFVFLRFQDFFCKFEIMEILGHDDRQFDFIMNVRASRKRNRIRIYAICLLVFIESNRRMDTRPRLQEEKWLCRTLIS